MFRVYGTQDNKVFDGDYAEIIVDDDGALLCKFLNRDDLGEGFYYGIDDSNHKYWILDLDNVKIRPVEVDEVTLYD